MKTTDIIKHIKEQKDKVNYFNKFSFITRDDIEGLLVNSLKEKKDPEKYLHEHLKDLVNETELKAIISDLPSYAKAMKGKI